MVHQRRLASQGTPTIRDGGAAAANEAIYRYPNSQEAAPIWFHDHLLGGTRLNVYAGLAGAYIVIDPGWRCPPACTPSVWSRVPGPIDLLDPAGHPGPDVRHQRQLYFPNVGINPEHPFWVPEFVGDTIVVNGKVWPYHERDRQRYRFLIINGSNARPYDMSLMDRATGIKGPPMWVIATDGGYLDAPVKIDPNATGAPARRACRRA